MSKREQVQLELAQHISEAERPRGGPYYDAPYGVLRDTKRLDNGGYVRVVTFGACRHLDAQALIFRPDRIVINAKGALARYIEGTYTSLEEVKKCLSLLASGNVNELLS